MHGMRYAMLVCENGLLKVMQMLCNSKVLINDLIDTYDRLARLYQQEKDS